MAKPLVIVESGAKAKTIAGFLGADSYTVMASVGHIRDLPRGAKYAPKSVTKPEVRRLGIDVDDHFTPDLRRARRQEAGRLAAEGRAQGRQRALPRDRRGPRGRGHLVAPPRGAQATRPGEADGVPRDHQRGDPGGDRELARPRHEVGRGAGGSAHPRPPRTATRCRTSRSAASVRGTSAGRVQSVATRLVVDRERARMAFRSGSYWDLEGTFAAAATPTTARSPRRS